MSTTVVDAAAVPRFRSKGLLPDASRQDALAVAERVRAAFEATGHRIGREPALVATVSAGVAVAEDPSWDLASLLRMADRALYRAKQQGRNRVESVCAADTPGAATDVAGASPHAPVTAA